jgi:hypothetical protein
MIVGCGAARATSGGSSGLWEHFLFCFAGQRHLSVLCFLLARFYIVSSVSHIKCFLLPFTVLFDWLHSECQHTCDV